MTPDAYLDRMVLTFSRVPGADRALLATMLRAMELLGRLVGTQLAVMRNTGEPVQVLAAQVTAQTVVVGAWRQACEIMAARWDRVPPRERPHYTPEQRFRILEVQRTLGLSAKRTARLFVLDPSTVARWSAEAAAHPERETVGSLVKPVPPVRRMADVVRHVVQRMGELGVVGNGMIARMVTRAGWRLSKRSAGRRKK